MAIFGVLFAFSIIIWLQVPNLVQKKMWRELTVFSVLIFIGMSLTIPQTLGLIMPSPNGLITFIFKPFAEWLKQ